MAHARQAARVFVYSFLGSLTTLLIGGQFFIETSIEGSTVPDWSLIDDLIISACISGLVGLMQWGMLILESDKGE